MRDGWTFWVVLVGLTGIVVGRGVATVLEPQSEEALRATVLRPTYIGGPPGTERSTALRAIPTVDAVRIRLPTDARIPPPAVVPPASGSAS